MFFFKVNGRHVQSHTMRGLAMQMRSYNDSTQPVTDEAQLDQEASDTIQM
jgi:hypothetical protein